MWKRILKAYQRIWWHLMDPNTIGSNHLVILNKCETSSKNSITQMVNYFTWTWFKKYLSSSFKWVFSLAWPLHFILPFVDGGWIHIYNFESWSKLYLHWKSPQVWVSLQPSCHDCEFTKNRERSPLLVNSGRPQGISHNLCQSALHRKKSKGVLFNALLDFAIA